MAKLTFVVNGELLNAVKRIAREKAVGVAEILRRAIINHNFFMEKLAEGKEIRIFDPETETYTVVDLK
jgi:hypothetical protein